jgi:ADP-ribose pyrophosphatase
VNKNSKICFSTPYFKIEQIDNLEIGCDPYYLMTASDSVIMCILDQSDSYVLVRQFRPTLNKFTLEFPAGAIDADELPVSTLYREMAEETGLNTKRYCYLGQFHLMMNRTKIIEHLFFCMDPQKSPLKSADPNISVIRIPRGDFKKLVESGNYSQLAGLGILQLINIKLNVSMILDSYQTIHSAFIKESRCL